MQSESNSLKIRYWTGEAKGEVSTPRIQLSKTGAEAQEVLLASHTQEMASLCEFWARCGRRDRLGSPRQPELRTVTFPFLDKSGHSWSFVLGSTDGAFEESESVVPVTAFSRRSALYVNGVLALARA